MPSKLSIKEDEVWNENITSFLKEFKENELFQKQENNFNWIQNFPWIHTSEVSKKEAESYYFSVYVKRFKNNYFIFYSANKEMVGFVWLNIKNGCLKVLNPYFSEEYINEIVQFIIRKCIENKVNTVLVFNSVLEEKLRNKLPYLFAKKFTQKYFVTKKIMSEFPEIKNKKIQSGDGDVVFT